MPELGNTLTLNSFDAFTVAALASRADGTYTRKINVKANSILASVFVKSGAGSVEVKYYDITSGNEAEGERFDLNSHPSISGGAGPVTNRILITRVHNKPRIEAIVSGGAVEFGIYWQPVMEAPADIDPALKLHDQTVDLVADKGLPEVIYDTAAGKWFFAKGVGGVQQVEAGVPTISANGTTTLTAITSTGWTALPTNSRKMILIQNQIGSGTAIRLRYGDAGAGVSTGTVVYEGGHIAYPADGNVTFYARADSGSPSVLTDEL